MNEYFLDKRKMKKYFKKYGTFILIALPFMALTSYLVYDKMSTWASDAVISFVAVIVILTCYVISNAIQIRKENKKEDAKTVIKTSNKNIKSNKNTNIEITTNVEENNKKNGEQ